MFSFSLSSFVSSLLLLFLAVLPLVLLVVSAAVGCCYHHLAVGGASCFHRRSLETPPLCSSRRCSCEQSWGRNQNGQLGIGTAEILLSHKRFKPSRVVLLDAGAKQELPHEPQLWIQELKDVVYDADDLVDEFVTLAEQKHLIEMAYELHSMLTDVVSLMTWEKVMPVYGGRNDNDSFLTKVVSPFYRVISEEAEKSKNGTADHSKWRNYDDLNEYFW